MMKFNPQERISPEEALSHPFLDWKNINDEFIYFILIHYSVWKIIKQHKYQILFDHDKKWEIKS